MIHEETNSLYQRIRFYVSLLKEMKNTKSTFVQIIDKSLRLLDISSLSIFSLNPIRKLDDSSFYSSVSSSLSFLISSLNSLPKHISSDPIISVIGYSHLDTCYLWPFHISRFKSTNTTSTMITLLENSSIPWKFLATSAQHYEWLEQDDPELFQKVLTLIEKNRWEVNGTTWVENETTLLSAESLVRQFLFGIQYFENKLHQKQTVLFLPDCFGFTGSLPQIMRQFEIDSFCTSKISWCEYNEFPYSTFRWRGIDGTDVFSHFISTPSKLSSQNTTYTGKATAAELIGTFENYKEKNLIPSVALHTVGNGDGGGGVTEEMIWNLKLLYELPRFDNLPFVHFTTLSELFEKIRPYESVLPIWDGELYLEYHRGTFTSQEEIKRLNRLLEAGLHSSEWFLSILFLIENDFVRFSHFKSSLDRIYKVTLLHQFHDALPGTSVNEVIFDILNSGRKCIQELLEIQNQLASNLASHISNENKENIVFNTLSHPRHLDKTLVPPSGWTNFSGTFPYSDIKTTVYERTVDDQYVEHELYYHHFTGFSNAKIEQNERDIQIQTSSLIIIISKDGFIESVRDIISHREYLSEKANVFELYDDRSITYPSWDIQLYHKEMQIVSPTLQSPCTLR